MSHRDNLQANFEYFNLAGSSVTTSFVNVGSATTKAGVWLQINHTVDDELLFTIDGSNTFMRLPAGNTTAQQAAIPLSSEGVELPVGTQFKVKGAAGGSAGQVNITMLYRDAQ